MTKSSRESLLDKIRALRAKTAAAGATEHEAMAAAAKAAELMTIYEVEEAELTARERRAPDLDVGMADKRTRGSQPPKVWMCCRALERLTRCKMVIDNGFKNGFRFVVFGDRPDRELFLYLFETIETAMSREYEAFRQAMGFSARNSKASFQTGMAVRVNERLGALIRDRDHLAPERAGPGSAMMVLVEAKERAVDALVKRMFRQTESTS